MTSSKSFLLLCALSSCQSADTVKQAKEEAFQQDTASHVPRLRLPRFPDLLPPKTKTREFAILPFSEGSESIPAGSKPAVLSERDIDLVYKLAQMAIDDYNIKEKRRDREYQKQYSDYSTSPDTISLVRYRLQLIPATTVSGDKIVCIRGFSGNSFIHWRTKTASMRDGGNSIFYVTINLSRRKWEKLLVNGDA